MADSHDHWSSMRTEWWRAGGSESCWPRCVVGSSLAHVVLLGICLLIQPVSEQTRPVLRVRLIEEAPVAAPSPAVAESVSVAVPARVATAVPRTPHRSSSRSLPSAVATPPVPTPLAVACPRASDSGGSPPSFASTGRDGAARRPRPLRPHRRPDSPKQSIRRSQWVRRERRKAGRRSARTEATNSPRPKRPPRARAAPFLSSNRAREGDSGQVRRRAAVEVPPQARKRERAGVTGWGREAVLRVPQECWRTGKVWRPTDAMEPNYSESSLARLGGCGPTPPTRGERDSRERWSCASVSPLTARLKPSRSSAPPATRCWMMRRSEHCEKAGPILCMAAGFATHSPTGSTGRS